MRKVILVLAVFGGVMAALTGLGVAGLLFLALAFSAPVAGAPLMLRALAFGIMVLFSGLGLALAWSGWRGLHGAASGPLRLPGWGWWLVAFALTVAAGTVVFEMGFEMPVAVLHVAANALAVFWALALAVGSAQRGQAAVARRPAVGSLAWGGLGGVGLAFFMEAMVLLVVVLFVSVWLTAARPDLLTQLQTWAEGMQRGRPGELSDLLPLFSSPWVLFAVLGFVSLLVPLVEEAVKALAIPLVVLAGRRVRWVDGFLLGAAAGAGFALVEGTLNGALGLASPETWAGAMVSRGAATTMHCAASALVGLGWALILERRWLVGLGAGLGAVVLHGAWNAAAVGLAARALVGGGNALAVLFIGYLGILWLFAASLLALLPRWLAGHDQDPVAVGIEASDGHSV